MSFFDRFRRKKKPKPPKPAPVVAPVKPKPVADRPLFTGFYSFCGHPKERVEFGKVPGSQCPQRFPWDAILTNDRKFALSSPGMAPYTYDESDPAMIEQIVRWFEGADTNHFIHQVECGWPQMDLEGTTRPEWAQSFPGEPLTMTHVADHHAKMNTKVKLGIAFWQRMASSGDMGNYWIDLKAHGWKKRQIEEGWRRFMNLVATKYMGLGHTLAANDRPVFFLGYAETLRFYDTEFGVAPEAIVRIMRDEVKQVTGGDLYLMATSTAVPEPEQVNERVFLKRWGFDGFSQYLLHGRDWFDAMSTYKYWIARDFRAAREANLKYWTPFTVGYDGAAWATHEHILGYRHMPTPAQFSAHVRETRALTLANYDVTDGYSNGYARGEGKGEGGDAEPMADLPGNLHRGAEMLEAFKAAL